VGNGARRVVYYDGLPAAAESKMEPNRSDPRDDAPRAARPHTRSGVGVALTLALASTALTVVAVVLLLWRGEKAARDWEARFDRVAEVLADLHERELGTREQMVARAAEVTEEVLHPEVERLATLQRQVAELRGSVFGASSPAESSRSEDGESSLLTEGDAMERIGELEEQILFLQARLYDLLEAGGRDASTAPRAVPLAPAPEGDLARLVERLQDPDPIERVTALFRLATVDDPGIVHHVIGRLEMDEDRYVRALSARILERVRARSAVPSLIEALEDPEPTVRECAVSALRGITSKTFLFDPLGPLEDRSKAVVEWRRWWRESWKAFLYEEE